VAAFTVIIIIRMVQKALQDITAFYSIVRNLGLGLMLTAYHVRLSKNVAI